MKKIKFLVIAAGIIAIASCTSAADKASGNYTGNYAIDSTSTYPVSGTVVAGTINVSKVSDTQVNMVLATVPASLSDPSDGINITTSGNVISFTYSHATTTDYDMLSLDGTIIGNSITVHGVMCYVGGNGVGTFTGTK